MSATEEWLPIPDFPGYEASNLGRIRSFRPFHGEPVPRILRQFDTGARRHRWLRLSRDGELHRMLVHRAVLAAFVGPPPAGAPITRHLDGDSSNNNLSNLRYGTISENGHDCVRHGTHNNASKTHCPKGHPYDEANTMYRPNGNRRCRTCVRAGHKALTLGPQP